MRLRSPVLIVLLLLTGASCSRDPEVVKRKYLENGNRYFDRGKYKEASIMYRNALKKDLRYPEAYYRLGLAQIKMGEKFWAEGIRALRRAIELDKNNMDARVQLADLLMVFYLGDPRKPASLREEIKGLTDELLKKDPNYVPALRIKGSLLLRADNNFKEAILYLQKANQVSPLHTEIVFPLAQSLLGDGQIEEAEGLAKILIEKEKTFGPIYDLLFVYYLRNNRLSDAESILKSKIANNPKQAEFLVQLAAYYFAVRRKPEMLSTVERLTANLKEFPSGRLLAGDFYLRTRDWDNATRQLEQGLRENPKDKATYKKRIAEVLLVQGKRAEATRALEEVLKENPGDDNAKAMRASLLIDPANPEQVQTAINELQSLVGRMPKNAVLRFNMARALMAKGQIEQARTQLQEAVKIDHAYLPARVTLARLHVFRREFGAALQAVQEILDIAPRNLQAKLIRADAQMGLGNLSQARETVVEAIKENPSSRDAVFQLGYLDLRDNRFKEAEAIFQKLRDTDSADLRGLFGLTETYAAQNQHDKAIQLLNTELAANPDRPGMRLALANLQARSGKYDQAIAAFQALIQKNPKSSSLYLSLGESFRLKGDITAAIDSFRKAKDLQPNDTRVYVPLALLLDQSGQKAEARSIYEQILKMQPDNPIALNNLAYMMAESGGDLDQALTLAQRAKQKLPQDPNVADTLGWIYIKKNLSDNAIEIFRDLATKQPDNSTYRYHLAMALFQKGDRPQAKKELQAALQRKPSKDEEKKILELMAKVG